MSNTGGNFRIYDPVAQLIATGGGGGGLPSTGGTLTGNLVLTSPAKVVQDTPPTNPNDLVNKAYIDSVIGSGPFLPLSGGTMSGQIVQSLAPTSANNLVNKAYVDSLIGGGPFLPLSGGTMSGQIVQSLVPLAANDLTNKAYVDNLVSGGPFLPLSGGTMSGQIIQSLAPTTTNNLANKAYVDAQVAAVVVPDATSSVKGIVQLSGDLSGTASAPVVSPLAITNAKLANLSAVSQLKGSSSTASTATDISLGSGLSMSGSTLSVNTSSLSSTFLPLSGGTMSGAISQPLAPAVGSDVANKAYIDAQVAAVVVPDATTSVKGIVQLAGDLSGTASAPVVSPLSITNAKLANLSAVSQLKGSSSTASTATDISLGSGLSMSGTTLSVNATTLQKAGTTQFGVVEFDPSGDLNASSSNSGIGVVKPLAITNAKLANLSAVSQLKGSSSTSSAATDITLGPSLTISGTTLAVNPASVPSIPVLVSQGGTGATTLTGYLKGNGTSPITSSSSVPTTDLTGQFVGSVNGVAPTPTNGGNVSILLGNVTTGTLAARPVSPGTNGNIYVVSGDPTPSNNGRTYISDGTAWQEVTTNQAATDARYVLKAGDTLSGNLNVPSGIKVILSDLPTGGTDAANKNYVDAQISSGSTPDATTSVKGKVQLAGDFDSTSTAAVPVIKNATSSVLGKIQLAGDLSGTASAPVVAPLSITNAKLANLSAVSQLKGSSSTASAATDISLGSGLSMSGTTLSVNTSSLSSTFLPLSGGTMSGAISQPLAPAVGSDVANKAYVDSQVAAVVVPDATTSVKGIVQLAGDLSGTASAPVVSPLSITNAKLANLSAVSQLKGSSSTASTATDISLGSGLSMSGSTLSVDTSSLSSTFLPLSGGTMSGAISQPLAPAVGSDVANKAYVDSQVAAVVVPDATTSVKGIVQLAGDLSGTASAPVVSPLSITNAKLANLSAVSQLKGSSSTASTATDISLGSGLSMSGSTLSVNTSSLSSTFLPLSGGTMSGAISQPLTPAVGSDVANKAYVDAQITSVTVPDATTSVKGKVQLAGDLSGTASAPVVSPLAITNAKLANLSAVSQLKGSSSTSSAATDITLGPSMSIIASQLNSAISFTSGTNPNITAPTDRPATSNILYVGTNGSVWVYQSSSSSYITIAGTQLYLSSNTNLTIPSGSNSILPVSDLAIPVANNQTIRATYYLRFQTVSSGWGPSFNFTGLNAATDILMGSAWWPQNLGNGTSITMYSFCGSQASTVINSFDSNVPGVLAGGSNTGPTFNASNNFTTCTLEIEYKNLSGSTVSLVVQFARDINNTSNAIRLSGGSVVYSFY
ncbi:hypothetical protein IIV30_007L [Invertebrate iridescent virus 30]|uniref:Uncharacterized protein n=1 Tax=Invertebrate iridescent virus 30 TaxID=345585 RepID=W8W1N5_9VIRU|nr:hypothetical protein IIV30_007L [Invertebrate iridescent virus 30]CCV02202.1 hypothetical protein IIV30_007L [Invertebrate iridescent virus 30]